MASMVFASPLSAQSFVKLRTNSNYSHSPCYISRAKNSYIHLPYKNISHIDSSKSLFLKGDSNFSFSTPKFPRVASTNSPSLNIIKACLENDNVYRFSVNHVETLEKAYEMTLDIYRNKILVIVNFPQQIDKLPLPASYEDEIKYLNHLHREYKKQTAKNIKESKSPPLVTGFEVLGFFPYCGKEEKGNPKLTHGEEKIYKLAEFPIFRKVYADDDNNKDNLWSYLKRKTNTTDQEPFDKFLVDGTGKPVRRYPWFVGETLKPMKDQKGGGVPHGIDRSKSPPDPFFSIQDAIDECFSKKP